MIDMLTNIGIKIEYLFLGQGILTLIVMILMILLLVQNFKLKKKYQRFMLGKNCESLESKIHELCKSTAEIEKTNESIAKQFKEMQHGIKCSYKKIGIVKYDAFKGMKGKLSFSLCLLDDFNSGYIINNMKGGDGNYTYLKEIIHGKSIVALGEEEKRALEEALECEKYE